jgi:hypothetical protein
MTCHLRLHVHLGIFDDLEVVDIDTGSAIPFDWVLVGGEPMIAVDDQFERCAAIRIVPQKLNPHHKKSSPA